MRVGPSRPIFTHRKRDTTYSTTDLAKVVLFDQRQLMLPLQPNSKEPLPGLSSILIVVNLTRALQGVFGGLALVFGEDYYLLLKFAGALVVYIAVVFFLARKNSFLATFKILSIFYLMAAVLGFIAMLFISESDKQIMNTYSVSSYVLLFLIYFSVFFVNKRKVTYGTDG